MFINKYTHFLIYIYTAVYTRVYIYAEFITFELYVEFINNIHLYIITLYLYKIKFKTKINKGFAILYIYNLNVIYILHINIHM